MRVKRLEIQGFKSFKDKTVIHFDHKITGIVGPNGCGKSNIVDAFFWVMGEQSYKHMRGTGSEDLIFNGSSKYNPLGMAEATMVLETDAVDSENAPSGATVADIPLHLRTKEISVTRRVYRSGEGEYFINGQLARLKDIQELFMDTGVGAKGYSVIEQGQIGKIVNAKPEDRRLLVEEAAGIAKYKARKKESLRKMEATHSNLSRLTDVIQEIERSLGSLERQAQKAKQYKKYKDELLDKEMTWGRRKTLVMRQKLESLRKEKEALEQELLGLRSELQVAENSMETDRASQLTDTKLAEDLQGKIQQLSDDLSQERSALDLSRRRQGDLTTQLQTLESEKAELQGAIARESERLAENEAEASTSDDTFRTAASEARTREENVRNLRKESETVRHALESAKRELMSGITQSSELTSRGASLQSRIESAQAQSERLREQAQALAEKLSVATDEAAQTQAAAEAIKAKRDEIQNEVSTRQGQLREQDQAVKAKERERDESMRDLLKLKSRLQSLEELASAREGLSDGPKAILEWAKSQGSDSFFAVAEALNVSEGFDAAVGGWLENRLESLLTRDVNLAVQAMKQSGETNPGRFSIEIPQNVTPHQSVPADRVRIALEASGFTVRGQLSDFVTASSELAQGLIAGVYVVESFEPLAQFLVDGGQEKLGSWSLVALNGDAFDCVGSAYVLRAGNMENDASSALLRRKRAIAELQTQVGEAEAAHEALEKNTAELKESLEHFRTALQSLQGDLQTLQVDAAANERDALQTARVVKDLEHQVQSVQAEIERNQAEEQRAREERETIEGRLAEIVSVRSDLEAQVAAGETEVAEKDSAVRSAEEELQAARVNEASLRERAQSLKRELESARSVISDRQRRLEEIERALQRANEEKEQFTGGDTDLEVKIEELTLALTSAREELSTVKNRLEHSAAQLNGALEKIKGLHKTGDQKTTDANQLTVEVEKLQSDLTHFIQNLEEKYGPGCLEKPVTSPIQEEMTEPVVTVEMTAEEELALGEEVERLRERIRRLGEVNVMAIEEYEELKKRYDYLLNEKADLERSIENLQEAIEHINKTSEERFRKAFEAIADRFERLFPIIFGGGQAKLSLVYPEGSTDILEAGVDIMAQPPGKKVVNIGLLSGGEKALTAVSMIFAIFMVKPSPFCVLDEVDAPLDDANIGKFNALLREMSVKSQFILITHNKKTMELNDTLYGVTMEEPGVSKMVSIEMN